MDLLETRELAYFVAVAQELHFGRAAERLGIAQPALSRAIRRLEHRLDVRLLARTSRHVGLTAPGEVLLHEGVHALGAVVAATRRTQRAAASTPRLVLAMKAGTDAGLLTDILAGYRSEPDAVPVEIVHSVDDRLTMLRDGRADAALLHRPNNDLRGLDSEDLLIEGQVVALAPDHPLASRASLQMADLDGEALARWPESVPDPSGQDSPVIRDAGQLTHLVSTRRGVALLPESALGQVPRSLVCLPVRDAGLTALVLAWPQESRSKAVAALVRQAGSVASRHRPVHDRPG